MFPSQQPAYEPVTGDSLTQFIRSLGNLTASQGTQTTQLGQQGYGTGFGIAQGALPTIQAGGTALAPALDYFTRLVKGDQSDVQNALAPQNAAIDQQFQAIRNLISSQPRGGGKAGALAEAPFQAATAKQDMAAQARAGAAQGLTGAASTLAGIGSQQAQVGTSLAGLGLGEQGLGAQELQTAINAALTRRGQNAGTNTSNLQLLTGGLEALI